MGLITHLIAFFGGVIVGWFILALISVNETIDDEEDERSEHDGL